MQPKFPYEETRRNELKQGDLPVRQGDVGCLLLSNIYAAQDLLESINTGMIQAIDLRASKTVLDFEGS